MASYNSSSSAAATSNISPKVLCKVSSFRARAVASFDRGSRILCSALPARPLIHQCIQFQATPHAQNRGDVSMWTRTHNLEGGLWSHERLTGQRAADQFDNRSR